MILTGLTIELRPVERRYIDLFLRWFNNPEVCQYTLRTRPLTREEEEEWLNKLHQRQGDVVFIVAEKGREEPIGTCGLHRISATNRGAELGIVIGEKDCWGRGFGTEAMNLLCEYGFQVLNLHRIGLSVYEYNARGIRCYEKVGFRIEGRLREARFWNGRYWETVQMGLLENEWRSRREASCNAAVGGC